MARSCSLPILEVGDGMTAVRMPARVGPLESAGAGHVADDQDHLDARAGWLAGGARAGRGSPARRPRTSLGVDQLEAAGGAAGR